MIPTYVINLKKDEQKRDYIQQHFADMGINDYQFFEAVDGSMLSQDQIDRLYDDQLARKYMRRSLVWGEIGCALSHLTIYQKIVDNKLPGAFIFEDDCKLNADTVALMEEISNCQLSNDEVVILSYASPYYRDNVLYKFSQTQYKIHKAQKAHGTYAYFITHKAASRLLSHLDKIFVPIDLWKKFDQDNIISLYAVIPYCVGIAGFADEHSTINPIRDRKARLGNKPFYSRLWNVIRIGLREHVRMKIAYFFKGLVHQEKKW